MKKVHKRYFILQLNEKNYMDKSLINDYIHMYVHWMDIYVYAERDGDVRWSMSERAKEGRHNSVTEARILHLWSTLPPHQVSRVLVQAAEVLYESFNWNTTNVMLNNKSTIIY